VKRVTEKRWSYPPSAREDGYTQGYRQGHRWAKTQASFVELDRLARLAQSVGRDWDNWLKGVGHVSRLARAIGALDGQDQAQEDLFWSGAFGPDYPQLIVNREFVRGFVEGSLEIYEQDAIHLGHA